MAHHRSWALDLVEGAYRSGRADGRVRSSYAMQGHGRAGEFKAELILKNFHTLLGRRVGRMFASLFDQDPTFKGRQVATLHNQRDYIFFR
jgi:ribosome production factor 1